MPFQEHLEDLTNASGAFRLPPPVLDAKHAPSLPPGASRRILDLRHLDSSETYPSDDGSIYDAELVLSKEGHGASDSIDEADPNIPPPAQPSASSTEILRAPTQQHASPAEVSSRAPNVQSAPRSKWPTTRLDTITERISQRPLRTSTSFSRAVSVSTTAPGDTVAPEYAAEGLRHQSNSHKTWQRPHQCHHRSFSLNDLDCLKLPLIHFSPKDSSSSSGDALQAACLCEKYPIHPREPPPARIPTPPGLPTFGTREALEYRMPPLERRAWIPPWRTSRTVLDTTGSTGSSPGVANVYNATRSNQSGLSDGLKRLLGINRVVSPIPEEPTRVPLPLYLARADDGTFVRGRFGTRHSAHGIGRGQLDNHPFHRDPGESSVPRVTSLDRAIQEIDKACVEAEQRRMASASPRAHGSVPRSRSASPRLSAQPALTIAEILQQSNVQTQNSPSSTWCSPRPVQETRQQASITFNRLGSGGSIRSQSTLGINGVRQFVERGERVSLEQHRELTEKKRERSKCANCWFGFCVFCCDMDDPDRDVIDTSRVMSPERRVSTVQSPEIRPLRIVREQPSRVQRMIYRS